MLLNWYSSMKKMSKIWIIFDIENWLWKSNFDTSPLHQFSKFNSFHWVCWFLGKNLSNFVSPAWKIDNPYYHTVKIIRWVRKYQSPHSLEKYISKEQFYFDFSSHFMFCEYFIDFSWKPLHIKNKNICTSKYHFNP